MKIKMRNHNLLRADERSIFRAAWTAPDMPWILGHLEKVERQIIHEHDVVHSQCGVEAVLRPLSHVLRPTFRHIQDPTLTCVVTLSTQCWHAHLQVLVRFLNVA